MKKIYRMYWRDMRRPDNWGEARPVGNIVEAQNICDKHNAAYPQYLHWWEEEEKQPSNG